MTSHAYHAKHVTSPWRLTPIVPWKSWKEESSQEAALLLSSREELFDCAQHGKLGVVCGNGSVVGYMHVVVRGNVTPRFAFARL